MERADVDGVHDPPEDADDDRRQHHRESGSPSARSARIGVSAIEQQGDAEPDEQLHGHGGDRQLDLHPHRAGEARILEQVEVVVEPER